MEVINGGSNSGWPVIGTWRVYLELVLNNRRMNMRGGGGGGEGEGENECWELLIEGGGRRRGRRGRRRRRCRCAGCWTGKQWRGGHHVDSQLESAIGNEEAEGRRWNGGWAPVLSSESQIDICVTLGCGFLSSIPVDNNWQVNRRPRPPAFLSAFLSAHPAVCLPACLPACPPACPPARLPARLPACPPALACPRCCLLRWLWTVQSDNRPSQLSIHSAGTTNKNKTRIK